MGPLSVVVDAKDMVESLRLSIGIGDLFGYLDHRNSG
jgi:hypothetical protein